MIRADKALAHMGVGTRSEIKRYISKGLVRINQKVCISVDMPVDPADMLIEFNGESFVYEEFTYLLMNKPQGVITATEDLRQKTVVDILPGRLGQMKLFPVGRLDIDTEGLLILTNDGGLSHRLLSPKNKVYKKYIAKIDKEINEEDIKLFNEGIMLDDGYKTLPASLSKVEIKDGYWVHAEICEGKFHQIKRMLAATGKNVLYLKRIKMGSLVLEESLKPGETRKLSRDEIESLKKL